MTDPVHGVRREDRRAVGSRGVLPEARERRAAEGESGIEDRSRSAPQRIAGDASEAGRGSARGTHQGGRDESAGPHPVGLQAGLSVDDGAGDSGAEGQGRQERSHPGGASTSRISRRNTSSTKCHHAGCTSCIPSTKCSRASSASRRMRCISNWSTRPRTPTRSMRSMPPARWSSTRRSSPKTVEREYLDKFPGWSRVDRHHRLAVGLG